jgi:hypothetical protein
VKTALRLGSPTSEGAPVPGASGSVLLALVVLAAGQRAARQERVDDVLRERETEVWKMLLGRALPQPIEPVEKITPLPSVVK